MIEYKQISLALEMFSMCVSAFIMMYLFWDRKNRTRTSRWFGIMTVSNMLMIIGDLLDLFLGGTSGIRAFYFVYLGAFLYFSASSVMAMGFWGYLNALAEEKEKKSKLIYMPGILCVVYESIVLIINIFSGFAFYVSEQNLYMRGPLFILLNAPTLIYLGAIGLLFLHHKRFSVREGIVFFLFIMVPTIASIVRYLHPEIAFYNAFFSLGLVFVMLFIQAEEKVHLKQSENELILLKNEKLEQSNDLMDYLITQLTLGWSKSAEMLDAYGPGHSVRVANISKEIAFHLGFDEAKQVETYYAALLHDIGNNRVPEAVRYKVGKYTSDELETMKMHTVAGYHMLKGISEMPELSYAARWHHEKYDGSGYPNGLRGEEIPLVARIVAVADAYDAMTTVRSYRKIFPQDLVKEQLEAGMGIQFDPKIAKIMIDIMNEDIDYEMSQVKGPKRSHVLIVDDDPFVHRFISMGMKEENYVISSAYNGGQAMEMLKQDPYDICLLDIQMPDINGYQVLDYIRENSRRTKVIFLTGEKSRDVVRQLTEEGVNDYLIKPIRMTQLLECIHGVINSK